MRITAVLDVAGMVGIDPASRRPRGRGRFPITREGLQGLIAMSHFDEIDIVLWRSEV
jgi:acetaldehyde dehydrogenase